MSCLVTPPAIILPRRGRTKRLVGGLLFPALHPRHFLDHDAVLGVAAGLDLLADPRDALVDDPADRDACLLGLLPADLPRALRDILAVGDPDPQLPRFLAPEGHIVLGLLIDAQAMRAALFGDRVCILQEKVGSAVGLRLT